MNLHIVNTDVPSALVIPFPIIIQTVDLYTLKLKNNNEKNYTGYFYQSSSQHKQ